MKIEKNLVVEMEYTLKDDDGQVLDTSDGREPLAYIHGFQNIIPGLEKELEGKAVGDELKVAVEPTEGYGERQDELVNKVPVSELAAIPDLQVGMQLQGQSEQGVQVFTIVALEGEEATLDGNHPLAGVNLNFEVKIVNVRTASEEEISHGHVHGPGGHQH